MFYIYFRDPGTLRAHWLPFSVGALFNPRHFYTDKIENGIWGGLNVEGFFNDLNSNGTISYSDKYSLQKFDELRV